MDLIDGRYRIVSEIGRGGMGVVYRATDVNLGREIALKLIAPDLVKDAIVIESFQQEARALARIRSHHVVQIFAFGPEKASFFFAMELIEGVTLSSIIDEHVLNGAAVPIARALTILRQLASGLDAVHAAGTIHRDVKPDNVIIEHGSGRPVLIDFGLATFGHASASAVVAGTPEYVSPEQIRGEPPLSPRTDLYAFATMAFELLGGGQLPFKAESAAEYFKKHAVDQPRPLSRVRPSLVMLDDVFDRALAKNPSERFESCREFLSTIEARLDHEEQRWSIPPHSYRNSQPLDEPLFDVLVLDRDPAFAKLAARAAAITFHGVRSRVAVAETGRDALAIAAERPPRLLLIDYDLPENGLDTIAKLRSLPNGSEMRVVVVTASEAKERWRFAVLGVEDFITKPIVLPDLLKALEELAARSNWRRAAVPKREHTSASASHSSTPPRSSMTISTSTPPAGIPIRPGKTGST